jgi:uncharacterized membrane protein
LSRLHKIYVAGSRLKAVINLRKVMSETVAAPVKVTFDPNDVKENSLIAALSYIGILCLIPLLAKKDSKFAQEHGKQGLVLLIAWIVLVVVGWIPILGWIVMFFGSIAMLIVALIAFIKCLMGEFWEVPVLGQYRHKFKL